MADIQGNMLLVFVFFVKDLFGEREHVRMCMRTHGGGGPGEKSLKQASH